MNMNVYKRIGRLTKVQNGVSYTNYKYDDQLNSLTTANNQNYLYDGVQNRKAATINDITTNYTIQSTSNRLTSSYGGGTSIDYQYDLAGNLIKDNLASYTYDDLNRLSSVMVDSQPLAKYQYNAFSQRIMKDVNGKKTAFIYNSAGQLLEEHNIAQNVIKDYVYVDNKLIAIMENGQNIYILTDHLNAPQVVMDSTGKAIWSAKYDPFGKTTIISNYKLNLRADGQYQDDETGLYYNWYRYYDPSIGRYITSDPLGLQAGTNTYIYVNGNPINYTDPMGLKSNIAPMRIDLDRNRIYTPSVQGDPVYVLKNAPTCAFAILDNQAFGAFKHARHAFYNHVCDLGFPDENSDVYKVCDTAAEFTGYGKDINMFYDFMKNGGAAGAYMYYQMYAKKLPKEYINIR